jgi:FixJ family two-component response regulator
MSGASLQKNLIESETEIPVIFISGECDEATQRRVLKAGAAGFFRKPFSLEPLLAAVRSVACLTIS